MALPFFSARPSNGKVWTPLAVVHPIGRSLDTIVRLVPALFGWHIAPSFGNVVAPQLVFFCFVCLLCWSVLGKIGRFEHFLVVQLSKSSDHRWEGSRQERKQRPCSKEHKYVFQRCRLIFFGGFLCLSELSLGVVSSFLLSSNIWLFKEFADYFAGRG